MKRIFEDNSFAIGGTPLVKLNRLTPDRGVTILAKIEGRNPGYSVKCRIGAAMVWDAERRGVLRPGMTIVEPTSGNTGIALAFVGAARGYRVVVTMPEDSSRERRKLIEAFGARVVLTDAAADMQGAVAKAMEIAESNPKRYFLPQQFNNPVNPAIHEQTTGPEIWHDTGGEVGAVVAGVGTGGTITGICRYLKSKSRKTILGVAVEPEESPVLRQKLQGKEIRPGRHTIAGIGAGFIPQVLDFSLLDRVEQVRSDEAAEYARRLAQEEGILSGPSSGAAVAVAVRLAREAEFAGKTIVVILPDSGERYLSTSLFKKSARPRRR